jgi:hypothetical protein
MLFLLTRTKNFIYIFFFHIYISLPSESFMKVTAFLICSVIIKQQEQWWWWMKPHLHMLKVSGHYINTQWVYLTDQFTRLHFMEDTYLQIDKNKDTIKWKFKRYKNILQRQFKKKKKH